MAEAACSPSAANSHQRIHWTVKRKRQQQDSNLRGKIPMDFESNALTARPCCRIVILFRVTHSTTGKTLYIIIRSYTYMGVPTFLVKWHGPNYGFNDTTSKEKLFAPGNSFSVPYGLLQRLPPQLLKMEKTNVMTLASLLETESQIKFLLNALVRSRSR